MPRSPLTSPTVLGSVLVLSLGLASCTQEQQKTPQNTPTAVGQNTTATAKTPQTPAISVADLVIPKAADGSVQDLHPVTPIGCQLPPGAMSQAQSTSALGKAITAADPEAFTAALSSQTATDDLTWAVPVIVKAGCPKLLQAALKKDLNPWQGEEMTRKTLAFDAIRSGSPELVQMLLKTPQPQNAFKEFATEFLGYSFCFQPWESSAALIAAGGQLNATKAGNPPVLIEAARCGQLASIAGGLKTLGNQMSIDEFFVHVIAATPSSQNTPKVKKAHLTAIKYLREQGAKPDQRFEITYPDAADKPVTTKTTAQELAKNPAIWPEVAQILN